jgi:hypothetical protein
VAVKLVLASSIGAIASAPVTLGKSSRNSGTRAAEPLIIVLGVGRLAADMIVRFSVALGITTDELLQPKVQKTPPPRRISRKVLNRLERIESLPRYKQRALLTTSDSFLRGM